MHVVEGLGCNHAGALPPPLRSPFPFEQNEQDTCGRRLDEVGQCLSLWTSDQLGLGSKARGYVCQEQPSALQGPPGSVIPQGNEWGS